MKDEEHKLDNFLSSYRLKLFTEVKKIVYNKL